MAPPDTGSRGPIEIVVLGRAILTRPSLPQAFFDKDYITKHPADAEKIAQLKELMQEQVCLAGLEARARGGRPGTTGWPLFSRASP